MFFCCSGAAEVPPRLPVQSSYGEVPLQSLASQCLRGEHLENRRRAVFRIHDILVWIRIRESMPLTNGSGSWIRILLFSSLTFKMPAKNYSNFLTQFFLLVTFLKVHLHYFSKIKSQKESQNSRIQDCYYFCMIEGSGSGSKAGSGSIPLTSGSGSGRQKNMWIWIRIRIRNTAWESGKP